jgi:hypothetical protein
MAGERVIKIKAIGDATGLTGMAGKANKSFSEMDDRVHRMGQRATFAAGAFVGLGAAWIATTGRTLMELEKLRAQTDTVIKSMGAAWTNTDHIVNFADKLEKLSGVEMEQVQAGQNLLLTYGNIQNRVGAGNDIFDQATRLMLDMSVATGKDMPSAATMLGKALNDPIKGVTALTKVGVSFTQAQRDQIAAMVQAGDVMGAQKVILAELTREFGGSAKALGESDAGQVTKFMNRVGDLSESLVSGLMPALSGALDLLGGVAMWLGEHEDLVRTVAVGLGGLAATWLAVRAAIAVTTAAQTAFQFVQAALNGTLFTSVSAFAAMSTAARIASVSMGAIGIIATAIGVAISFFSGESEDAAQKQQDLANAGREVADAIAAQNGVIDENIRKSVAQKAEQQGLLQYAKQAGISTQELVDGLLNQGDAYNEVLPKLIAYAQATKGYADMSETEKAVVLEKAKAFNDLHNQIDADIDANEREREAAQQSSDAREAGTQTIEAQTAALQALISEIEKAAGLQEDNITATSAYYESLDALSTAIQENGVNIDQHTEKGRNNIAALVDNAQKARDMASANAALGVSQDTVSAQMQTARDAFIAAAREMGFDATQAQALADKLGLIPGDYIARVSADTQPAMNAVSKLDEWIRQVLDPGYSTNVTAGVPLPGFPPPRAAGGPVLSGQAYRVGERGEEIFQPPNTGRIIPNYALGEGSTTIFVTIDGQQLQGRIDRTVRDHDRQTKRTASSRSAASRRDR